MTKQRLPWWLSWQRICLQCRRPWFDSWVRKILWRRDRLPTPVFLGFPCGSAGKESACNMGDLGLIPGLGRSPGEGKGYPLQYSGLDNSMDYIVRGVTKSRTRLNDFHTRWQSERKVQRVSHQQFNLWLWSNSHSGVLESVYMASQEPGVHISSQLHIQCHQAGS